MLSDELIDRFAIRCAKGNNGGEWAMHYTEEQKNFWRRFVRELAENIAWEAGSVRSARAAGDDLVLVPRKATAQMIKDSYYAAMSESAEHTWDKMIESWLTSVTPPAPSSTSRSTAGEPQDR